VPDSALATRSPLRAGDGEVVGADQGQLGVVGELSGIDGDGVLAAPLALLPVMVGAAARW